MRFALCVTMLAVCLVALQYTEANNIAESQNGDQSSEDLRAAAATATTTNESQPITIPVVPETPQAPVVSANPVITTESDDRTSFQSPSKNSSPDLDNQQQLQSKQNKTGQTSGVTQEEHHAKILPQGDKLPNQGEKQSQSDLKPPSAATLPQTSHGQLSSEQSQQSQEPQTDTSQSEAKSQDKIGKASQTWTNCTTDNYHCTRT